MTAGKWSSCRCELMQHHRRHQTKPPRDQKKQKGAPCHEQTVQTSKHRPRLAIVTKLRWKRRWKRLRRSKVCAANQFRGSTASAIRSNKFSGIKRAVNAKSKPFVPLWKNCSTSNSNLLHRCTINVNNQFGDGNTKGRMRS